MFDTPHEKTDRELRVLAVEAAVAIYPHIDHSITQTCPADVRETILWLHAFLTGSDDGAARLSIPREPLPGYSDFFARRNAALCKTCLDTGSYAEPGPGGSLIQCDCRAGQDFPKPLREGDKCTACGEGTLSQPKDAPNLECSKCAVEFEIFE